MFRSLSYLGGNPGLNNVTWFLVCLFSAELLVNLFGLLKKQGALNLLIGLLFIVIGYFITKHISFISGFTKLELNFWYIHESLIAIGYFLIGNSIYPFLRHLEAKQKGFVILITLVIAAVFAGSQILIKNTAVVLMINSQHGDFVPFIIQSLSGSLTVIGMSKWIPPNRIMDFIGANTLILLGLNGLFFHFINRYVAQWTAIDDSGWFITLNGIGITLVSLLVCFPVILVLNKYFPQLFGKPFTEGPLLKSF